MLCSECGSDKHKVIRTKRPSSDDIIERIRQCSKCGYPFLTEEKKKYDEKAD
ncbi:hypothetical protein KAR91_12015 [Candidatus Pacearchaeota archaeon]|nr:hypothetical protein [Candidatus Pacearchaeota archaeon]